MAIVPHLTGHLRHHDSSTDGSFQICIASGIGVFVQQAVYESIPQPFRPPLNTSQAIFGDGIETIGSTVMPFVLVDKITATSFELKMHALVVPTLFLGMFIGYGNNILNNWKLGRCEDGSMRWTFHLDLGNGRMVTVENN